MLSYLILSYLILSFEDTSDSQFRLKAEREWDSEGFGVNVGNELFALDARGLHDDLQSIPFHMQIGMERDDIGVTLQ